MHMSCPSGPAVDGPNQQAYEDVSCAREPRDLTDPLYMSRYMFWRKLAGEAHFDPNNDSDTDGY